MIKLIEKFINTVGEDGIEIYNEFSFQHELGMFLRTNISDKKVQFERNVSHFRFKKSLFEKKEIDISIFSNPNSELNCALELKYPRNGQVPETMYSFCKDIAFLEQLVRAGFKKAYFVVVVDDPLFYSGNSTGIYGLFRANKPITGKVIKPTGAKNTSVTINGTYFAEWKKIGNGSKYCIIKIHT